MTQPIWRLTLENMDIVSDALVRLYEDRDAMQREINVLRENCLRLSVRVALDELFPPDKDQATTYKTRSGDKTGITI